MIYRLLPITGGLVNIMPYRGCIMFGGVLLDLVCGMLRIISVLIINDRKYEEKDNACIWNSTGGY